MRRFVTAIGILIIIATLARCTAKKTISKPTTPEEIVAYLSKRHDANDMAHGRQIFETTCKKCHVLKPPASKTIPEWERILPRMALKSNLERKEYEHVRAYVLTNASI